MKAKNRRLLTYVLIAGIVTAGAVGAIYGVSILIAGLSGTGLEEAEIEEEAPTEISFNITDWSTADEVEPAIARYERDCEDDDLDEIEDLAFADFTLDTTGDEDMIFEPETDHNYWLVISETGYISESWYYYTKGSPRDELSDWQLGLGVNYIYMMNQTEDADILCYNSTLGTYFHLEDGSGFVANWTSDDRDWSVITLMDNSTEEGLKNVYDFENDWFNKTIIRVTFNDTAQLLFGQLKGYEYDEAVSGNSTLFAIDHTFIDTDALELRFSSGIGTDYYIQSIDLMYGDIDGTPVLYDTQTPPS